MKAQKRHYLASMQWCERNQPIIIGTNKKKLLTAALKILKEEHGYGKVCRGQAMCRVKITRDDILIQEIKYLAE